MPATLAGTIPVKPLRIVLVTGPYTKADTIARELTALGGWLETHANPLTTTTIVDTKTRRLSQPLPPAQLATRPGERATQPFTTVTAALNHALRRGRGKQLIITLDHLRPRTRPSAAVLVLRSRPNAPLADPVAVAASHTLQLTIDTRRHEALAATISRAVITLTNMREER